MEENAVNMTTLAGTHADLSIISLFWEADWIVKLVIVLLLMASIWSWSIIFAKVSHLSKIRRRSNRFEDEFWSGESLDNLYNRTGQRPADPMSSLFAAAMREWKRGASHGLTAGNLAGLQERVERVMHVTLAREMERLERHLTFLASVGSSAPFVGLFGTVWGIMNSFSSIAASKQTNLAVVAPGIAEALFATALGLVAAIPATIAYNKISSDLGQYAGRLEAFSSEFSAIISRQLDERG